MDRRTFILKVAKYGGSAYAAMTAMRLLASPETKASSFSGLSGNGNDTHIVILGAGIAGMTVAYELSKVGYNCTILEARTRAGGRCWTVRRGTEETEIGGEKQVAQFDEGLYLNVGPARIPQHHITLDYCKELSIPIEIFTNVNEAAYYYKEGEGELAYQPVRIREIKADMRGYVAELLAKAINQDALDLPVTAEDKEMMVYFLQSEGGLNPDLFYKGSSRRGFRVLPGAGLQPGKLADPFELEALIRSGFGFHFASEYSLDDQMSVFQPVGGMDQIVKALEKQLADHQIFYQAKVTEIRKTSDGIRVVYQDQVQKQHREITGDFCICTIPLRVLKDIPSDFSPSVKTAINNVAYTSTCKVGLQFARRFWEEDDRIFGGITRINQTISQIFYPSYGYLSKKGILTGCYNSGDKAERIGNLSIDGRIKQTLSQGSKIHPQYTQEFESGFSVAWQKIPYSLGGWASYNGNTRRYYYSVLNQPDGNIYLAGEHLSYYTGWLAGAFESARSVVSAIHSRVQVSRI